jgi:hypothetical protein
MAPKPEVPGQAKLNGNLLVHVDWLLVLTLG